MLAAFAKSTEDADRKLDAKRNQKWRKYPTPKPADICYSNQSQAHEWEPVRHEHRPHHLILYRCAHCHLYQCHWTPVAETQDQKAGTP